MRDERDRSRDEAVLRPESELDSLVIPRRFRRQRLVQQSLMYQNSDARGGLWLSGVINCEKETSRSLTLTDLHKEIGK